MSSMRDRIKAAKSKTPRHLLDKYASWRMAHPELDWSAETIGMAEDILRRREQGYPFMRFSPSAANGCVRAAVISFMGYKSSQAPNIRINNIFDIGNFGHLKWQMLLYEMGVLVKPEVVVSYPDWYVAGTTDGILEIPLKGYEREMSRKDVRDLVTSGTVPVWRGILEIKQMNEWRYKNNKVAGSPEEKVRWQGDVYYFAGERYEHNFDGTCYWFQNNNNGEVTEFSLPPTSGIRDTITAYYDVVKAYVDAGTLPERPYLDGSTECNGCFFADHCAAFERKGKTAIKPARGKKRGDFQVDKNW